MIGGAQMHSVRNVVILLLTIVFSGLGARAADPSPVRIRVSLPPVFASLPIAFAEEWGLFDAQGVDVQIVGMADNGVRSAALAAEQLDLVIEDTSQFILDLQRGMNLVATSAAYIEPQSGSMHLALISPASYRLDSLDDLIEQKNYLIGTLPQSDHEYMLDRLISDSLSEGQTKPRYTYISDPVLLATGIGAGWFPAVVLPEPYITYITTYTPPGGKPINARILSDFADYEAPPNLIVVRAEFAEAHPDAIEAFYTAYKEGIERVNRTSRAELVETGLDVVLPIFFQGADPSLIGQEVLDAIPIPTFGLPQPMSPDLYADVLAWMDARGYVFLRPTYAEVFRDGYLP